MKIRFFSQVCLLFFCIYSASSYAQKNIKVMTYNILHGAPPGLKKAPHKIDLNAVANVIKSATPDIVALQEVDSAWYRSDNQEQAKVLAEKTGLKYFYFSDSKSFTDTAGWGYGIAILSRYPLKNKQTVFLPHNNHPGSENWVNSEATVLLPNGKSFRFICAHFDYLNKDNSLLEAKATNKVTENTKIPVILAGDLNSTPSSEAIAELEKAFKRTCTSCALTFSSDKPRVKLDYIMYSKKSPFKIIDANVLENDETRFASDHLPYIVTLEWE